jgi:hypothetical protein
MRGTPEWLINLPAGTYTVKQLLEISGRSARSSMHEQMKKYGATYEQRKTTTNLWEYVYIWHGYQIVYNKKYN